MLPAGGDSGSTPGSWGIVPYTVKPMWEGTIGGTTYKWTRDFVTQYLGVPLNASNQPTTQENALRCPSSPAKVELKYSSLYAHYCTPGMSTYEAPYRFAYAVAKASILWETSLSGLPRVFSYDAAVYDATPGPDSGNKMRTHYPRSPHMSGGRCSGMNMTTVDGAGRWVGRSECRVTSWGWWVYYQRMFPRDYEILIQGHRNYGTMRNSGNPYDRAIADLPALVTYGTTNTIHTLVYQRNGQVWVLRPVVVDA